MISLSLSNTFDLILELELLRPSMTNTEIAISKAPSIDMMMPVSRIFVTTGKLYTRLYHNGTFGQMLQ